MNWLKTVINAVSSLHVREKEPHKFTVPNASFDESKIHTDYSVTEKWHKGWKRPLSQIEEAVIHRTMGNGDWEDLRAWMLAGERKKQYKRGIALFHFAISPNGHIWKLGPIGRWWYASTSGQHDKKCINIELIGFGPFTEEQYESLFWLLFEYAPHFCSNYHRIVSHDYNGNTYSGVKKGCVGPHFDWSKLEGEIVNRGYNFENFGFEHYNLIKPV